MFSLQPCNNANNRATIPCITSIKKSRRDSTARDSLANFVNAHTQRTRNTLRISLRSRLARYLEDDASSWCEDARIKYDGINIDDACPGERVQLEIRGKKPVGRAGKGERRESYMSERWEKEREREKKRVRARRVSRSRDPRCDGVIGYELTGAKGPSRVPRCGADLEGVNWSRGRNRFITKREERRRRDFARTARTTLRIRRCLFCACTHTLCYSLLSLARLPLRCLSSFFFISPCAARGR